MIEGNSQSTKVHVPKKTLTEALTHVGRIIPSRSSNPGLGLLKLELKDGLILSGSNMDIDVQASIAADIEGESQEGEDQTAALPAQVFAQVVRALPGELVELAFEGKELEINSGSYATKLQLADPETAVQLHFPQDYQGAVEGSGLLTALGHVRYAAAVAEYQAIFRGVKLELGKKLRAVATDGFRLAYYDLGESSGLAAEVVLPARSVDELLKFPFEGEVQLELTDGQLSLAAKGYRLNLKLMEGSFPDYERVIPAEFQVSITTSAQALAETVSRVAVVADKTANNRVDLFIEGGSLQITAEGGYGRAQEALEVSQEGSEPQIALAYNAKYLVDALQPLRGELRFSFSGTTSPSVLASLEDPGYLAMVVPLRTG